MKPHELIAKYFHSWFFTACFGLYSVAALAIMFIGRGSFTSFFLVLALILYAGAPLFLLSLILWGIARYRRKDSWARDAKRGLFVSLCLAALMFPTWGADRVAKYDVTRAKAFCESLLPELNDIHAKTGAYPEDISTLESYKNPPWLLRYESFYYSNGDSFSFSFHDNVTLLESWTLKDSEQTWWH